MKIESTETCDRENIDASTGNTPEWIMNCIANRLSCKRYKLGIESDTKPDRIITLLLRCPTRQEDVLLEITKESLEEIPFGNALCGTGFQGASPGWLVRIH